MKVLFITRAIPLHSTAGGMERAAWDLAVALSPNADVTVLTTAVPGYGETFIHESVSVKTVQRTRSGRYSLRWWIGSLRSVRATQLSSSDAVVSVSAGGTPVIWFNRAPVALFQAHGSALRELESTVRGRPRLWVLKALRLAYWAVVDRGTYRRSDAVVTIGPAVTASLSSRFYRHAVARTTLVEIANGIDTQRLARSPESRREARKAFGLSDSKSVALVIARLVPQKGVDLTLEALSNSDADLLIVGDGPSKSDLERQASRLGISGRVRFVGSLDRDGVRSALHAADLFTFTPRNIGREGLPLSVLEALAAGLPVACPGGRLWPRDILSQLTIVDTTDATALGRAISQARTLHPTSLPESYSVRSVADRYLALITQLSSRPKRRERRIAPK